MKKEQKTKKGKKPSTRASVQVYGPTDPGDWSAIIGTRKGLEQLRKAIDEALTSPRLSSCVESLPTDNVAAGVLVVCTQENWSQLKLGDPYNIDDRSYATRSKGVKYPWDIIIERMKIPL